jgi:hypothetical protein
MRLSKHAVGCNALRISIELDIGCTLLDVGCTLLIVA